MSCEVDSLRNELASFEERCNEAEREKSDLKGRLSTAEGEISALNIEHEHEKQQLAEKVNFYVLGFCFYFILISFLVFHRKKTI